MFNIGITERGDAGLDHSWVDKLLPINIIISKSLNDWLIENLINFKEKIIFHMTCTGFGGTILEPNVPDKMQTFIQLRKLIDDGFPASQIVFRIDPIIPSIKGIETISFLIDYILLKFPELSRIRYSFIDMYPHVIKRFNDAHLKLPFKNAFQAPSDMMNAALKVLKQYSHTKLEFESCAENNNNKLGCISHKDFNILGIDLPNCISCPGKQRKSCLCLEGKTELLSNKKRCPNKCLYCYWRD